MGMTLRSFIGRLIMGSNRPAQGRTHRRRLAARAWPVELLEERSLLASVFTVTNTADDGNMGSLRWAINQVNADTGTDPDTIDFNISGVAPFTIYPFSALPTITHPVILDGTSQPGYSGTPIIDLNGLAAGRGTPGLTLQTHNCTIEGLVINLFQGQGILLQSANNNLIQGNFIGTDITGRFPYNNFDDGIEFADNTSCSNNTIGGTTASARNLISGNSGTGIDFILGLATNNLIEGNYIGTDVTGTVHLGNNADGIAFSAQATSNLVANNLISGNVGNGITLFSGSTDNVIQNNLIGTDVTGTQPLPNIGNGVDINNPAGITVTSNVISANGGIGLHAGGNNAIIQGNKIGTDITGTQNLGNIQGGVIVDGGNVLIGGPAPSNGNIIAFNSATGVVVSNNSTGVGILSNTIFANGGLGIDLGNDGVTSNTPGGPHSGANLGQNFPVLTGAIGFKSITLVRGTLNSIPSTSFMVQFFSNPTADPSGYGQGQVYLGSTQVSTDASGNATFQVGLPVGFPAGQFISATATDPNNDTSEFSQDLTVTQGAASVVVGSTLPGSTYGQAVSFTVTVSGGGPVPQGTVQFVVDGTNFGSPVTLSGGSATSPSTTLLGAGSHTILAQYSGDSNYAASTGSYTQVVNQAPLSIVPDNLSRAVGQSNPPLTYHFTGFVNGENAGSAGITGAADLATTATISSPAGSYPITVVDVGTLSAANYNFPSAGFGSGTLTVLIGPPSVLPGWAYYRSLTDSNSTSLTNFVTKVTLTSSNFDFSLAKPDGSDLRVYDVTSGTVLPLWLFNYDSVAQTATVYFLAANTSDVQRLYYGNASATAVSNSTAVLTHGTGFDSGWADVSTAAVGTTAAAPSYAGATSTSDPRNFNLWGLAESPTLSISDLTAAGVPAGNYTGVREFSLVRDANDRVLQINGKYYAFFARRPSVNTAPIDTWRCESTSPTGPWSNFVQVYAPPTNIHVGYASSCIQVGSTYYLFMTYGWTSGGGTTPGLAVYVMTSPDLTTWSAISKIVDPSIFHDQTGGSVTDIGNPWVIKCADGTYMMTVEGMVPGGKWACYGATSTDLVNWTALNSGNALISPGTGAQWDFNGTANPKCIQLPDGTYAIEYAGSDDTTNSDWEIGFATASSRGGPYTKLSANPVIGRSGGSYGIEPSDFSYDQNGTSFFNIIQRFDTTSSTGHEYFVYNEPKQGGLLLSRDNSGADAAIAGRALDPGTFVAESRSVITANRSNNATPIILGLYNAASLPAPGTSTSLGSNRRVEILRSSPDRTTTAGDIGLTYWDNNSTRYWWNGSSWTTTVSWLPADNARDVVASISDDGSNYILKATYADTGALTGGPAIIPKSSVGSFGAGRQLLVGDPFTDAWTDGLYLRYIDVRPYAATEPSIAVGSLASVAATSYTFMGPSSDMVNTASSNFTVTPNGVYTGTITIMPSGGGLTTPIVLTFSNSAAPQTFTITPTQTGTVTLTPTNSGSLTNPSNLTFSVTGTSSVLPGWAYYRSLTDSNSTSLTNFVTKVTLTSSNFDFSLAKPDGSDLRVYDVTSGTVLPLWLFNYDSVGQTGTVYYLAANTSDVERLYYGNASATAVSNFAAVFPHGTGFDSNWGDLSTALGGPTAAATVYPGATSISDPRNLDIWSMAESPTLSISDLTAAGVPAGNYTGVREFSLVRDANDRVLQINGKYYAFFARRPSDNSAPIDTWRCESTSPTGPWSNFTQIYSPPSPVHCGYPSSCIKIGSTYYLFLTYGWTSGDGQTPPLSVYVMTSADLTTWSAISKIVDPGIFNDQSSGACTNIGNPWVIKCVDGTYMMTVEGYGAGGKSACYGATSTDLVNWTALNSGNALISPGTGAQWDFNGVTTPKCLQLPDGSYVIEYAGSGNATTNDSQIGFTTASSRGGPYTKLSANPVIGRPGGSYGLEASDFSYDQNGTSFFNIIQRYDTTGSTGHAYFVYNEPKQGGLLLSRDNAGADAAIAGRTLDAGTFVAESRSVITANRSNNATPIILGLYNAASLPAPGTEASLASNRRVEILRSSPDRTTTAGDIGLTYWDNNSTRYWWNGSSWTTTVTWLPADSAREVVASILDDGSNYILKATYADTGSLIGGPATIAKSSVGNFSAGRQLLVGDPFTDMWTSGLYLRYIDVRPYAATEPSIAVGSLTSVAATSYTLTGPSSGTVNTASSNFTVTPNGVYTGTITITPSGGGLTTPIVLTFSNSAAPQTFTITPTQTGTVTLTPANSGGLTDPLAVNYIVGGTNAEKLDFASGFLL